MPILIEVRENSPLNQGDILKDIALFQTDSNWAQGGGQPRTVKPPVCMVLSRPCAVLHKPQIVVASIERVKGQTPKDVKSFAQVKQYLEELRDGFDSPDRFYLGHDIPTLAQSGRFFARLDSLCTIRLPDSDALARLLSSHRVATLSDEFRRDLHRRIFSAFAALGFDDCGWYSNRDLDWLIKAGEAEGCQLDSLVREKEQTIAKNRSSGMEDKNTASAAEVRKLQSDLQSILEELKAYNEESAKRQRAAD